jgi:hypothetical protein
VPHYLGQGGVVPENIEDSGLVFNANYDAQRYRVLADGSVDATDDPTAPIPPNTIETVADERRIPELADGSPSSNTAYSGLAPAGFYPDAGALAAQAREADRERLIANCRNPETRARLASQIAMNRRHQY